MERVCVEPAARCARGSVVSILLCASGLVAAWPLSAQAAGLCETNESYRTLDFLLGDWRLVSGGETVGRSRVEKLEDGCLVAETWTFDDGRSGRTYSAFDAAEGVWRRFSVSNRGEVVRSFGAIEEGALLLRGERVSADGRTADWRERVAPLANGRVRRVAGHSGQGRRRDRLAGVAFDGHYERVGAPALDLAEADEAPPSPAEPPSVRKAPEKLPAEPESTEPRASSAEPESDHSPAETEDSPAPAAGAVRPASARAVDAAAIERIAMASPMMLRVPLGPVESLPEGYGWVTRETAPYLCEGVTIEGVQVERRARRGRVELDVEVAVHGSRGTRRVSIDVDLRRGGRPDDDLAVASGAAAGRVGRNIPEQIEHGSVAFELPLSMDAAVFDEIVVDAERPELVITLTVGG